MTQKGIEYNAVDYTKQPLSAEELKKLLHSAGLKPIDAIRTREAAYKKWVEGKNLSDEQLLALMAKHPQLIQRPLAVRGKKVVLARPVERLGDLGI